MFISKVYKKDIKTDKKYYYFRLMRSYRIGNKTRQEYILNLGILENLPSEKHKFLADRIEQILEGNSKIFASEILVEQLAKKFSNQIIDEKKFFFNKTIEKQIVTPEIRDFEIVDVNSIESENGREIGAEWLAKQAIEQIGFHNFLNNQNISDKLIKTSQIAIISRMVHPASDLETERWLNENSDLNFLFDLKEDEITRADLTKAANYLYENKEIIEQKIYQNITNLFSLQSKIVIYDLTNIFFEGRKVGSSYCKFGRSKEKRSDCRIICLALIIDEHGFIFHSRFYAGNQSEPQTLADVVKDLKQKTNFDNQLPVIVMDAGITTEENLLDLRNEKQDYICVSRSKLKKYEIVETTPIIVEDNRKHKIELQKIKPEGKDDFFVLVKSEQKQLKEQSMSDKFTDKFEKEIVLFNENLQKKGAHNKSVDVYQRIGRLKERHNLISGLYELKFIEDTKKGTIISIEWTKKQNIDKFDGTYFIRYSNEKLTTQQIWETYNTIREVENTFRTLKTDLQIRPIYHQNDKEILSHIFVGIIAYQIVNTIRFQLKKNDISFSWDKIVKKLNTYKSVTTDMETKDNKKIILKYCLRPSPQVKNIFDLLKYKILPFQKQKFVVTKLQT